MKTLRVNLPRPSVSYDIHIGFGILDRGVFMIARSGWGRDYTVVSDERVFHHHGRRLMGLLADMGLAAQSVTFPPGEASKTVETALAVARALAAQGADRSSALIALGGGVVGDLTGFVAAVYMRGIPYIQVPTTLMAQVDSAVGGKTAVDEGGAKNILGVFHQPKAVIIDLELLETLPPREFVNGLAEIVKYGIIEEPDLLDLLEANRKALEDRDRDFMTTVVSRSCRIKKGIVEIDEEERGVRRVLNFGHTVGHAVEAASGYVIPHGEAVAMGMAAAAGLSERLGHLPRGDRERIVRCLTSLGLPVALPAGVETEAVMEAMKRDKKKEGERINFVLLKRPGMPFINGGVPPALVREVLEEGRS